MIEVSHEFKRAENDWQQRMKHFLERHEINTTCMSFERVGRCVEVAVLELGN